MVSSTGLQFTLQRASGANDDTTDAPAVIDFHLEETLSTPFALTVNFASRQHDLSASDWLDREVSLAIWQDGAVVRRIHGVVSEFAQATAAIGVPITPSPSSRPCGGSPCATTRASSRTSRR